MASCARRAEKSARWRRARAARRKLNLRGTMDARRAETASRPLSAIDTRGAGHRLSVYVAFAAARFSRVYIRLPACKRLGVFREQAVSW